MSRHDMFVDTQEASPPVANEEVAPVSVLTPEDNERVGPERQGEQVPAVDPDKGPDEGVAGQEAVPNLATKEPEKHEASPSTFVSSLHVSSVEQRTGGPSKGDVFPVSEGDREGSDGSGIIYSLA
ncbi:uncharacterized protein CC84DRAFT_1169380 [Paraphaeosphaeria sporulosa]|uniref:Uncharacterized protein n=1 Tax=Paraphaeosphaeria sporulosa TaxID=1460663 RepID=A0A177BV95_9PLEO|nr:uncharacterized protein CC84DRAFT_1169380 [Paraphaeosphaeria sporulosa]OAF99234.1 hypothetical protein CC84DRAFT_1169380 [Paraphaeosphaeria sporulosa]